MPPTPHAFKLSLTIVMKFFRSHPLGSLRHNYLGEIPLASSRTGELNLATELHYTNNKEQKSVLRARQAFRLAVLAQLVHTLGSCFLQRDWPQPIQILFQSSYSV